MGKVISIDPITRLEGHGKIDIILDDDGNPIQSYLQVPELRGFEDFAVGRRAEEMPQITSRICGVCPGAHHMASTKTLDSLFKVTPTPAATAIRELYYYLHMFEDHLLHFYILGGPDFVVGPGAPKGERNVLGVVGKVGLETGKKLIQIRKAARDLISEIAGKNVHPVLGLPGGVAKAVSEELRERVKKFSKEAIDFALFTLKVFHEIILDNKEYRDLIFSDSYYHETYYMGMVDKNDHVAFYDGEMKVIKPDGTELLRFKPEEYASVIGEHVETWTYIKFPFLKEIGWHGFVDGEASGIYRVSPIGRLNAASGMATVQAQEEYEKLFKTLGAKPVHQTLAAHWARLVETVYAAERIKELSVLEELTSPKIRNMDLQTPSQGYGIVEAPRGTLIHHYNTDENGIITKCNLVVASLGNSAAMSMSVDRAVKTLIKNGKVDDKILNMVEMAFRAYDPCLGCATHALPGKMPIELRLRDKAGNLVRKIIR